MGSARKQNEGTAAVDDEWVSLYGAADMLGISTKTVLARVVAGDLQGMKVAGRIVVTRASVEKLAAKNEG